MDSLVAVLVSVPVEAGWFVVTPSGCAEVSGGIIPPDVEGLNETIDNDAETTLSLAAVPGDRVNELIVGCVKVAERIQLVGVEESQSQKMLVNNVLEVSWIVLKDVHSWVVTLEDIWISDNAVLVLITK